MRGHRQEKAGPPYAATTRGALHFHSKTPASPGKRPRDVPRGPARLSHPLDGELSPTSGAEQAQGRRVPGDPRARLVTDSAVHSIRGRREGRKARAPPPGRAGKVKGPAEGVRQELERTPPSVQVASLPLKRTAVPARADDVEHVVDPDLADG